MRRLTARALAAAALLVALVAGCKGTDYRPEAIGREAEIIVVMDSISWNGEVGAALRGTLGEYISTLPAPEPAFDLRRMDIEVSFGEIQRHKNVVFAAPLSDTTAVARFLRTRLPEGAQDSLQAIGGIAIHRENLWRRNQMVVYFTASDAASLTRTIHEESNDVRYLFNRITRRRVTRDIFDRGRQHELEERLRENHGFSVNMQHDFFIAVDTTNFVWLRRVLSDTWRSIFIYYVENANPADLSPEWIYTIRDSLSRTWLQGNLGGFPETDARRPLETENIDFLGRYGFETRGLWQMVGEHEDGTRFQFGGGGPFVNYTFYDQPSGRIYMIDGMVFAPNYEKREFLRHMEAIAHTFVAVPASQEQPRAMREARAAETSANNFSR